MTEPPLKRKKSNEECDIASHEDFISPHDRILTEENTKFRVQSKLLIKHSEYFRIMFTSEFKEKNTEETKLEDCSAKEFEIFLAALTDPDDFKITEKNLGILAERCHYYQASEYLVKLCQEKEVFKNFPVEDLFKLAIELEYPEFKNAIEMFLIKMYNLKTDYSERSSIFSVIFGYREPYTEWIQVFLKLTSEHNLLNLKAIIEHEMIAETLEEFKKSDFPIVGTFYRQYGSCGLNMLKEFIEDELIKLAKSQKWFTDKRIRFESSCNGRGAISAFMNLAVEFDFANLINTIDAQLVKCYPYRTSIKWQTVYVEYAKYPLVMLQKVVENNAIEKFRSYEYYISILEKYFFFGWMTEKFPRLLVEIDNHIANEYFLCKEKHKPEIEDNYMNLICAYKLNKLKEQIEQHIMGKCDGKSDYKLFMNYLEKVNSIQLQVFKDLIETTLLTEFETNKEIEMAGTSNLFDFQELKISIENHLIEKMMNDDSTDNVLWKYFENSKKWNMDSLEEQIENRLITELLAYKDLKNISSAYTGHFLKFKKNVTDLLSANCNNPLLKNAGPNILLLSAKQQLSLFHSILGVSEE